MTRRRIRRTTMFPRQHSSFDAAALYCEEEDDFWDDGELIQSPAFVEGGGDNDEFLECDDEEFHLMLLKKEEEIRDALAESPILGGIRAEAVEWMLSVVVYYSFSAQTAALAINYLDRFLYSFRRNCHAEKPWTIHLAAVASLSLAAKVEETHVPLLLNLQVDSKYVFESKTIQKMEMLILSTLQWKMNPVTPLSFLHYISSKIGFKGYLCRDFVRRCESLLLAVLADCRFTACSCLPSSLATATILFVLKSIDPSIAGEFHGQLIGILGISQDKVETCFSLIEEAAVKLNSDSKRKTGPIPESPTGVVDVCFSSDNISFHDISGSVSSSPAAAPPPPPYKKPKSGD